MVNAFKGQAMKIIGKSLNVIAYLHLASSNPENFGYTTLVYRVVNPVTFSESESAWLQGRARRECVLPFQEPQGRRWARLFSRSGSPQRVRV